MNKYKVTWSDIYHKNINSRKYTQGCFDNAIEKLGGGMVPVYAGPDDVNPIGWAINFQVNNNEEKLTADIFTEFNADAINSSEFCLAGSGDTVWTERDGRGWLAINPDTYKLMSVYLSKKSAFPVSMSMEIVNNE